VDANQRPSSPYTPVPDGALRRSFSQWESPHFAPAPPLPNALTARHASDATTRLSTERESGSVDRDGWAVVGGGDEQPFAAAGVQATAGHRGQLLAGLDLAEHWFHGLCPEFVVVPAAVVAHPGGRNWVRTSDPSLVRRVGRVAVWRWTWPGVLSSCTDSGWLGLGVAWRWWPLALCLAL
jgi:hypothetical protein